MDELRDLQPDELETRLESIDARTADELRARLHSEAGTLAEHTTPTVKDQSEAATVAPDGENAPPPTPGVEDVRSDLKSTHRQLVGRKLGPYSIKRLIGSGGMGQVWEAIQKKPQRSVALKILRAAIVSPAARERFQFEVEILGRLRHPNIAQIYNAGELDLDGEKIPYFAMEFIASAEPIDVYCRKKRLDLTQKLSLFTKVCEAVSHGHQRGIIHRDLKPANILVDKEGRPKVIDYGVARASDSDTRATIARTNVGQLIGTLQYMSPEQCSADPNDIDIRADVYSLGVILYELLADQLPYDLRRIAIAEAVQVIQNVMPPRLSTFGREIAHDVEVIAGKALEKEPERRYRSAGDLADDVKRFLADEPIMARPPSMSEIIRRYARKNKPMATAIMGISAAIIIGVVGIVLFAFEADRAREDAENANIALEESLERESAARTLAEDRFEQVRNLTREMLGPIAREIKNLEGSNQAQQMMTKIAREYLSELKAARPDKEDLDDEIAVAHENLGDLLGGRQATSVGRIEEALDEYVSAEAILRSPSDDPMVDLYRRGNLSRLLQKRGEILYWIGDEQAIEQANEFFKESRSLAISVYEDSDRNEISTQRLFSILMKTGDLLLDNGDLGKAMIYYDEALERNRELLAEDPENWNLNRDIALLERRFAWILEERGELDQSNDLWSTSLERMRANLASDENSVRHRWDVAWSCYHYGSYLDAHTDDDRGPDLLVESLGGMTSVCLSAPEEEQYRNDLGRVAEAVYEILMESGHERRANDALEESLLLIQPVAESMPENLALEQLRARLFTLRKRDGDP